MATNWLSWFHSEVLPSFLAFAQRAFAAFESRFLAAAESLLTRRARRPLRR
jgi:hypothetical protein